MLSHWPAEPQQCCAASPGQSSCGQLCRWDTRGVAPGRSRAPAGHRDSPARHLPGSGPGGGCAGMDVPAEGLTGSCGTAGTGAAGPGTARGIWAAGQAGHTDPAVPSWPWQTMGFG